MTVLNQQAKQALQHLTDKHRVYVIAKETIEAELREVLQERLASYKIERDVALRLADEAGVPRTQLGKAIGTSNYRTVQEILASTEDVVSAEETVDGSWTLAPDANGSYVLSIQNVGPSGVSGTAVVNLINGDIEYVSGDEYVIAQVYRNGLAEKIVRGND